MNIEALFKITFVLLYFLFLVWRGFRPKIGFAGWYMFANVTKCQFKLKILLKSKKSFKHFNPWNYLPHSYLSMNMSNLRFFLFYLREVKKLDLYGCIEVREGLLVKTVKVVKSHVVD